MIWRFINFSILILFIWYIFTTFRRSKNSFGRWSKEKNLKVINKELRVIRTGPFPIIQMVEYSPVYRIEIQHKDGQTERGWFRAGGIFSKSVTTIWDSDLKNPPASVRILDALFALFIVGGLFFLLFTETLRILHK